jgi:hypothetical protein
MGNMYKHESDSTGPTKRVVTPYPEGIEDKVKLTLWVATQWQI